MVSTPPKPRRALRPAALLGLAVWGAVAPTHAKVPPQRQALMARVDAVRQKLHADPSAVVGVGVGVGVGTTLTAQASSWTNWPKWSKWSNWANT